jgi:hypothetical protein
MPIRAIPLGPNQRGHPQPLRIQVIVEGETVIFAVFYGKPVSDNAFRVPLFSAKSPSHRPKISHGETFGISIVPA